MEVLQVIVKEVASCLHQLDNECIFRAIFGRDLE